MKKISIIFTFIACAMMFVGCQKEFNGILTAKIEKYNGSNNKVYINSSNYACWNDGDSIKINGKGYPITITTTEATIATGDLRNKAITAIYPASYAVGSSKSYKLPKIQEYQVDESGRQKVMAPMVAYADAGSSELTFKNAGALIQVIVKNPTTEQQIILRRIELTGSTNTPLWGTVTYDQSSNGDPTGFNIINNNDDKNTIALIFPDDMILNNEAKSFYIAVPALKTSLTPTIYYSIKNSQIKNENNFSTGEKAGPLTITRNRIDNMNLANTTMTKPKWKRWVGSGSKYDPNLIYTYGDYAELMDSASHWNYQYYKQMKDITRLERTQGGYHFHGNYNGNNHILTINHDGTIYRPGGMFQSLTGSGTVSNIKVKINITRQYSEAETWPTGGIADHSEGENVKIINCTILENSTITGNKYVGGIVGQIDNGKCTIQKCTNNANLKGRISNTGTLGGYVGGIVGYNQGIANIDTDCSNNGTINDAVSTTLIGHSD